MSITKKREGLSHRMSNEVTSADQWLETLGYFRVRMPRDENCLYQAASFQIFSSHLYYDAVRDFSYNYMINNSEEFRSAFMNLDCWKKFLENLNKRTITCGYVELHMISFAYKKCIIVFNGSSRTIEKIGDHIYTNEVRLCYTGHHYDAVNILQNVGEEEKVCLAGKETPEIVCNELTTNEIASNNIQAPPLNLTTSPEIDLTLKPPGSNVTPSNEIDSTVKAPTSNVVPSVEIDLTLKPPHSSVIPSNEIDSTVKAPPSNVIPSVEIDSTIKPPTSRVIPSNEITTNVNPPPSNVTSSDVNASNIIPPPENAINVKPPPENTSNVITSPEIPSNSENNAGAVYHQQTPEEKPTHSDLLDTARAPGPICSCKKGKTRVERYLEEELLGKTCVLESENGEVMKGYISDILEEDLCQVYIPSRYEVRKIKISHLQQHINTGPPTTTRSRRGKGNNRRGHTASCAQNSNRNNCNRNAGPSTSKPCQHARNLRMPQTELLCNNNTATPVNNGQDYMIPVRIRNYSYHQPQMNRNISTQQVPWYNFVYPPGINGTTVAENQGFPNPATAVPMLVTPAPQPQQPPQPQPEMQPMMVWQYPAYVDQNGNIINNNAYN